MSFNVSIRRPQLVNPGIDSRKLQTTRKKPLYAVSYSKYFVKCNSCGFDHNTARKITCIMCRASIRSASGEWRLLTLHVHADSQGEARHSFMKDPDHWLPYCRIIAVGLVVGFFVEDKHGEKLSAQ